MLCDREWDNTNGSVSIHPGSKEDRKGSKDLACECDKMRNK